MRIFVVGAGQVGSTVVEALHEEHDITVVDLDPARLDTLGYQYELQPVEGNGASRRVLREAGIEAADLLIACTSRDEVNVVTSMFAKKLSPETKTIVRTTNVEYLELWQERELDVDFVVSSELETAHAISRLIGVPAARHTDVFADGQVQMVEFDVVSTATPADFVGSPLREARIPAESKVASIIRGDRMILPRGDESIEPGDRVVIIGSPAAAREWSRLLTSEEKLFDDVVVVGGGQTGSAVGRMLLAQGIRVRIVESVLARARAVAEELPDARVFHATGTDPDFLERERIGDASAAVFVMPDDAKNLYAATLAKLHGVPFTIGVVRHPLSQEVFAQAGIDVAVNPQAVTAEEIVRFAHDPRIRQLAMLEGDRFEVLDITVRPESDLCGRPFKELPMTGSLIGAIVRDGEAIFPHGDDRLEPGDRAIIFTESTRVQQVERAL
ncbi:MAG TPA: Trk system potassium transporter TrkA [Gaiellaceae bacterium]|jgi:trk system potassium uptake protein TrkA